MLNLVDHHIMHFIALDSRIDIVKKVVGVTQLLITAILKIYLDYLVGWHTIINQPFTEQGEKQIRLTSTSNSAHNFNTMIVSTSNQAV